MQIHFTHIFGPVLVIVTFLVFGQNIINRTRGKHFRPLPAFLLFLAAVAYRFLLPEATLTAAYGFMGNDASLLDRLCIMLMDFGIGMTIDAAFLASKGEQPRLFWVPGLLALLISGGIYVFVNLCDTLIDTLRASLRGKPTTTELLMELGEDDHLAEIQPTLDRYHAAAEQAFPTVTMAQNPDLAQTWLIYVDSAHAQALLQDLRTDRENIDHADPNGPMAIPAPQAAAPTPPQPGATTANDPLMPQQWYAQTLQYPQAYDLLRNLTPARKARIAIIDTGVETAHEDLAEITTPTPTTTDPQGHGTHCAGIAAAATHNALGMASLNWAGAFLQIAPYRALAPNGAGTHETVAQAIIDATQDRADVISLSLGSLNPVPPRAVAAAVQFALRQGCIVVAAAGNANMDARLFSPANIEGVIAVAALDPQGAKATFSNTNTSLQRPLAAPGVDILSATPGGGYRPMSGTSMAAPLVAGTLGIMRALQPAITPAEAYQILRATAKPTAAAPATGPLIQPAAAIARLAPQRP